MVVEVAAGDVHNNYKILYFYFFHAFHFISQRIQLTHIMTYKTQTFEIYFTQACEYVSWCLTSWNTFNCEIIGRSKSPFKCRKLNKIELDMNFSNLYTNTNYCHYNYFISRWYGEYIFYVKIAILQKRNLVKYRIQTSISFLTFTHVVTTVFLMAHPIKWRKYINRQRTLTI